jgi:hypothetical protein
MCGDFPLQQWLCKCTTLLSYTYTAYVVLLLELCVVSDRYMNMRWEKGVLFKDAINDNII